MSSTLGIGAIERFVRPECGEVTSASGVASLDGALWPPGFGLTLLVDGRATPRAIAAAEGVPAGTRSTATSLLGLAHKSGAMTVTKSDATQNIRSKAEHHLPRHWNPSARSSRRRVRTVRSQWSQSATGSNSWRSLRPLGRLAPGVVPTRQSKGL